MTATRGGPAPGGRPPAPPPGGTGTATPPPATPPPAPAPGRPPRPRTRVAERARPVLESVPGRLAGLSVGQIITWQAALAAIVAAATHPAPGSIAAGSVGVVALALTTIRGRGRWLYQTIGLRRRFKSRQRPPQPAPNPDPRLAVVQELLPALDVTGVSMRSGQRLGVIYDGSGWVGIVAIRSDAEVLARPHQAGWLPVRELARALVVDDIALAGLQVLRHATPAPAGVLPAQAPMAASYHTLNRQRIPGSQHVWIAARLDPTLCPEAIEVRGGGVEGVHRAVRRCVARVVELLDGAGVPASPLDEDSARSVLALAAGALPITAPPETRRAAESWSAWRGDGTVHVSWWVRSWPGRGVPMQLLQEITAAVPSVSCTISLTLHPEQTEGARFRSIVRVSAHTPAAASAAGESLERGCAAAGIGLYRLDGEQALGLVATLPLGGIRL